VIELMLEAERAMGFGLIDNAERLYGQVVAADPHNSIAVTGLARVALERGDQRGAYTYARQALAIDPDNPVAGHLAHRMAEQLQMRGEVLPDAGTAMNPGPTDPGLAMATRTPDAGSAPAGAAVPPAPTRPGLVARLLRRRR
jgi:hypothetical protein